MIKIQNQEPKITMTRRNVESFLMGCRRYGVTEVLLANNQNFPAWISDQLIVSLSRDNENRSIFEFIKDLAFTNHASFAEIMITILFILENSQSDVVKLSVIQGGHQPANLCSINDITDKKSPACLHRTVMALDKHLSALLNSKAWNHRMTTNV
uniref:Uncharacterized protein n=1 Tax=Romanomermis culicivorax TaxID=13658 RepID=A0A915JCK5_ROMCU